MANTKRQRTVKLMQAAHRATGRVPKPSVDKKKKKVKLSGAARQAVEEKAARKKAAKAPSPASDVKTGQVKQVRPLNPTAKSMKLGAVGKAVDKMKKGRGLPKVQNLPVPVAEPKAKTGKSLVPAKGRALQVISQASKAAKSMPMPLPLKAAMWAGSAVLPWLIGKGLPEGDSPKQMTKKNQRGQRVITKRGIAGMPSDPTWSDKAAVAPKQANENAGVKRKVASSVKGYYPSLEKAQAKTQPGDNKHAYEGNQYVNKKGEDITKITSKSGKQWVDISDGGLEDKMGKWIAGKVGSYEAYSGVEGTSSWIKKKFRRTKSGQAIRTH